MTVWEFEHQAAKKSESHATSCCRGCTLTEALLGGSWDLVSTVISTLSGVISNCKYSYLNYNPSY